MILQVWGNQKIPILWVGAAITILIGTQQYADIRYMRFAHAEGVLQEQTKKMQGAGEMLTEHIRDYEREKRLSDWRQVLRDIERTQDVQAIEAMFVSVNGESALTRSRATILINRLEALKAQRDCLSEGNLNCK